MQNVGIKTHTCQICGKNTGEKLILEKKVLTGYSKSQFQTYFSTTVEQFEVLLLVLVLASRIHGKLPYGL